MPRARRAPLIAFCAASLLAGCSNSIDLVVDLRTDLVPGIEFVAVTVELYDRSGRRGPLASSDATALRTHDYFSGRRVADFGPLVAGSYELRIGLNHLLVGTEGAWRTQGDRDRLASVLVQRVRLVGATVGSWPEQSPAEAGIADAVRLALTGQPATARQRLTELATETREGAWLQVIGILRPILAARSGDFEEGPTLITAAQGVDRGGDETPFFDD